ncbi:hypothetical protein IU399_27470 [Salmonella enterica subsp. enterica serovar Worthington]|nr:hypothetical protein [Salmonella enterica subsp. enterica serovar Worthington]
MVGGSWMVEFDEVLCTGLFECCNYFVLSGPAAFGGGGAIWCFRIGADVSPLQERASSACPQGRR